MRKLPIALAALGLAVSAYAQNCNSAPPPATFATRDPFGATNYVGNTTNDSYNMLFDANVQSPISITGMRVTCYDQGVGNPVVPNQVGATSVVNIYSHPTTHVGNNSSSTGWTLLGSGTITVVAWGGESPVTFSTPVAVPAGQWGIAIEIMPTVSGPSPGGLHGLIVLPASPLTVSDSFITMTNMHIQQTGWTNAVPGVSFAAGLNLKMDYTPAASAALWTNLGEGCYFRSHGFYEEFATPNSVPDLANSSMSFLPNVGIAGPNYLVASTGIPYVTPTGVKRNSVPSAVVPAGYTAGTWDDALDAPITLPFTFNFPGGSTTDVTATSNGSLFLANVANGDRAYGYYSSLYQLRDYEPRIAAFWGDLDLEPTSPTTGGLYYETDGVSYARFSWDQVAEWTPGNNGPLNSFQITLWVDGHVDISYANLAIAAADAVVGFHDGGGRRLPAGPNDLSVDMPFFSGDGAIPPILGMDARPVIGTSPNIVTSNITPGTSFQIFIGGLQGLPTPIDLSFAGMPGCFQYINPFTAFLSGIGGNGTFSVPFTIPNDNAFQNVQFFFQAAPLTTGLNSGGFLASNGVCAKIGQ